MKFLIILFYLFTFCPYIKIVNGLDTQPGSLIISFILTFIFLKKEQKINKNYLICVLICIFSVFLIDFEDILTSTRSILNYWSLIFISYASFKIMILKGLNKKIVKIFINIWFLCGFIQTFFFRFFLQFLISDMRTSESRGVTGLAPEPTFYGIICIFWIILVIEKFELKERRIYLLNLLIQIFIFSQSSMTILFLGILITIFLLEKISFQRIILSIAIYISISIVIILFLKDTRVYNLYNQIVDIKKLFYTDHSLNQRLSHIYYSLKGSIQNFLIPNGFTNWLEYSFQESSSKKYFHTFHMSDRIMSGYGAIIYEMGILGIILIIYIYKFLLKGLKNKVIATFYIIISFSAIQLSNPFNGFILGYALYNIKKKKQILRRKKYEKIKSNDSCRN